MRGKIYGVGALALLVMWIYLARSGSAPLTPSARLSAAIEVLGDIEARRRPAADALKDWGLSHRFAGSGDRAAIAGLVYDALRRRASSAWIMGEDTPRAVVLGMLRRERGLDAEAIARLRDGSRFAPAPLTDEERARLRAQTLRTRRRMSRATIPNGSMRISRRSSATSGQRRRRRWRRARRSTCASIR